MLWLIGVLFGLAAIVTAFFSPRLAWLPIALVDAFLLWTLFGIRGRTNVPIAGLSSTANDLMRRFGQFYTNPWAGAAYSSTASMMVVMGVVVAAVCAFKHYWWGLLFGALNYAVMSVVAWNFNPTKVLVSQAERDAHDEILTHMSKSKHAPPTPSG